jgi:G patch domain-containing protein 1
VYDLSISRRSGREIAYDGDEPTTSGPEPRYSKMPHSQDRVTRPLSTDSFHDGRPVLPGFVLSNTPVAEDAWSVSLCQWSHVRLIFFMRRFKIPDIPKGWKPDPHRVWSLSSPSMTRQTVSSVTLGRPETVRFKTSGNTLAEEVRVDFCKRL